MEMPSTAVTSTGLLCSLLVSGISGIDEDDLLEFFLLCFPV